MIEKGRKPIIQSFWLVELIENPSKALIHFAHFTWATENRRSGKVRRIEITQEILTRDIPGSSD